MGLQFRFGTIPDSQNQALERLKSLDTIRQKRLQDGGFQADVSDAVTRELTAWKKQWANDEERQTRQAGQNFTEVDMESHLRELMLDQAWIERQIAADTRITEAELSNTYQAHHAQFKIPPSYRVAHLFLSHYSSNQKDRSHEIRALHRRLIQGEPWEALVETYSEDARTQKHRGDLGWMTHKRTPTEFITAVQQLKPREISSPLRSSLGWHLISVTYHRPERLPTLQEVCPELATTLIQQKRQIAIEKLLDRHPGCAFENDGRH